MNKGISLAIVAVLLCAMGIIFFMNINNSKEEINLAQPPLEEVRPTNAASDPQTDTSGLPLIADQNTGEPSATSSQAPQSSSKTTTTPSTATSQQKAETAKPSTTEKQPVSQKPAEEKTATSKSPEVKPADSTLASSSTSPSDQTNAQAPSLKPLEAKEQKTTATAQTPAGEHTLSKIGLHFRGNDIYLRIEATTPFKTKVFALTQPDRLVVDLVGKWHKVTPPTIPSNQLVTKARIGNQPNATRLVLDLSRSTQYTIEKPSDSVIEILMK